VFVHVGLPKTGTTHVQATLAANRPLLTAQGLLYPRAPRHPQHFLAALDFLQVRFGAIRPSDVAGLWQQLTSSVQAWSGTALVSHELLAGASSDDVARLVQDFAPRDVHAIVSVRDLSRLLPAVWQERAKNRVVESWAEFRADVSRGPDADSPHDFWKLHDVESIIAVWRRHVPDDHIHVVTVPRSGVDESLLFDRFASVLGVDPTGFTVPDAAANASIGALELAVLREINVVARRRIDRLTYQTMVKRYLVPQVLAQRADQLKVTMPEPDRAWVEGYTAHVCELLGEGGPDVVGELADLAPTNFAVVDPADPAQSGEFSDTAVASALAEVVVEVLAKRAFEEAARAGGPGRGRRASREALRGTAEPAPEVVVRRAPRLHRLVGAGRRLLRRLRG